MQSAPKIDMQQKRALITGITGQDGAYLAELLLDKNYIVYGLQQLSATPNTQNIDHLKNDIALINGDMADANNITKILSNTRPDEAYNLAGQSHVGVSFDMPEYTAQVNAMGTLRLLESIRILNLDTKFYQASTSEIFGNAPAPQNENTQLSPCSPYAAAKVYAHHMVKIYREAYSMFACNGILFNHESPIRGEEFVTRKITKAIANKAVLELGNLNAKRDWGHARDYVRGMWMMMQTDTADDYVLATGQSHSVRDFVEKCYAHINVNIEWQGNGTDEIGLNKTTKETLVKINPDLYRPNELHELCGDATKAKSNLGWRPEISFDNLISEMMESDLEKTNFAPPLLRGKISS